MWNNDLRWSAAQFHDLVWPHLQSKIGGELIHVEAATNSEMAKMLDIEAGIDAWHVVNGRGMRGIASRVQCGRPWNTFTVRKSRDSGAMTEFEKRLAALNSDRGWLFPALTVQAYVSEKRGGELYSVGVVNTRKLIEHIRDRGAPVRRTTNAEFFYLRFNEIADFTYISNSGEMYGELPY